MPVRTGHGRQARRQPVRQAPHHHDARSGAREDLAGAVRAGQDRRHAFRGPFVPVPRARNPRPDVPILPQPRRRRVGSGHGRPDGDSVRLPLPQVLHGFRPRVLDAADDRDGLEHARRSLSAARGQSPHRLARKAARRPSYPVPRPTPAPRHGIESGRRVLRCPPQLDPPAPLVPARMLQFEAFREGVRCRRRRGQGHAGEQGRGGCRHLRPGSHSRRQAPRPGEA